jgi:hypothetical protein
MVPKRQARRAVTRNLVKRQMRESFRRHAAALPMGLWLLRLHAGFCRRRLPVGGRRPRWPRPCGASSTGCWRRQHAR